jgi:hypothetical protein
MGKKEPCCRIDFEDGSSAWRRLVDISKRKDNEGRTTGKLKISEISIGMTVFARAPSAPVNTIQRGTVSAIQDQMPDTDVVRDSRNAFDDRLEAEDKEKKARQNVNHIIFISF